MAIGVIGSGSWATAIVKILHENNPRVNWYIRQEESRREVRTRHRNPRYLSDVRFNMEHLHLADSIDELVETSEVIFVVVPSAYLATWFEPLTADLSSRLVVTAIKGIVPGEHLTASEFLKRHHGLSYAHMGVVSGPCHAEEVAMQRLSYLTVACKAPEDSERVANLLRSDYIRVTPSQDIYGTEYSAILKNIYAVASGIGHGLGYGDNFQAVLTCNAQDELERFLEGTYPSPRNANASPYLGDLLVTCYSQFSRNRTFGLMIGKGYSVLSAQMEMNMVAEGYYASDGIDHISRQHGVELPIAETIHRILYEGANARREFEQLSTLLV